MRIDKDRNKEILNIRNHGFDFSFAEHVFADPLSVTVYDRYENGEDRWHTLAMVGNTVLVVVHAYPDPDDETWVRVIGLRKATPYERERYEEDHID